MIIPFFIPHAGCPHQCVFCNQENITGRNKPPAPESIPSTINEFLKTSDTNEPVEVAFYGGTFTALPLGTQCAYLSAVAPFIQSDTIKSIRLSTRPDCVTPEVLDLLKRYHVETVELGVQSLDDRVLSLSGRGHTSADSITAVKLLREYGFFIGLQLMPGLPGDSATLFMETVEKSAALKPDIIRIYPTLVIKNTRLEKLYTTGRYIPLSFEQAVVLCKEALLEFEEAGIEVVRIGLQPEEELEKPGTILAGPYHPAFRQVIESEILLDRIRSALKEKKTAGRELTLFVNPRDVSAAVGQKRCNVEALKKNYGFRVIRVHADKGIQRRAVKTTCS